MQSQRPADEGKTGTMGNSGKEQIHASEKGLAGNSYG